MSIIVASKPKIRFSCAHQCWTGNIIFFYSILLILAWYGYLMIYIYILSFNTIHESSYLGKITPVSIQFKTVPTRLITQEYQYLTCIITSRPQIHSFDTIVDVDYLYTCIHLYLYRANIGAYRVQFRVVFNYRGRIWVRFLNPVTTHTLLQLPWDIKGLRCPSTLTPLIQIPKQHDSSQSLCSLEHVHYGAFRLLDT